MMTIDPPLRIISLVPSLTETICDFGLQSQLVGCTHFCVHPVSLRKTVPAVGGTKDADIEKISALNPTHVIVNHEENTEDLIAALKKHPALSSCRVIETFPKTPLESIETVKELARIFNVENKITKWVEDSAKLLTQCQKNQPQNKTKYAYFIWRNPWMVAGNHTYIANMLALIGMENIFITSDTLKERYPQIELENSILKTADFYFFSSEPFPFKNRHIEEFLEKTQLPAHKAHKIDGELISWYGTRTLKGLEYLIQLKERIFLS